MVDSARMAGRTLSSVGRPFRSRRTMRTGAASTFSIRSPISSPGTLSTSNSQVHDATSCWSDPSVSATNAATWTSMPSGSKALRAAGICATGVSPGRAAPRRTSRYSPSDSQPVGRASPKLTSGWGTKPCEYATGSPLRRNARSHIRATSRWLVKRILPSLEKRRRSRRFSSGSTADELDRDAVALGEVLARALAPARRRHSRRHDVLEAELRAGAAVVTRRPSAVLDGNARRARPASRPTESRGAGRQRCGPTAAPRTRPGRGDTPRRSSAPRRRAPPPTARGRSARTTPGTCPRRARPVRSRRPSDGRPGWPAPRPPRRAGRASGW